MERSVIYSWGQYLFEQGERKKQQHSFHQEYLDYFGVRFMWSITSFVSVKRMNGKQCLVPLGEITKHAVMPFGLNDAPSVFYLTQIDNLIPVTRSHARTHARTHARAHILTPQRPESRLFIFPMRLKNILHDMQRPLEEKVLEVKKKRNAWITALQQLHTETWGDNSEYSNGTQYSWKYCTKTKSTV